MIKATLEFDAPLPIISGLMREYAVQLGIDLCFQNFKEELATLPGRYAAPGGALLVAYSDGQPAGCGAYRPWQDGVCEMKRLYTRPAYRGLGLGRQIAEALLTKAEQAGYRAMRLDTLPSMTEALALYESLGFRQIPPYYANPVAGCLYLEADLTLRATASLSQPTPATCKASAETDSAPGPSSIRAR